MSTPHSPRITSARRASRVQFAKGKSVPVRYAQAVHRRLRLIWRRFVALSNASGLACSSRSTSDKLPPHPLRAPEAQPGSTHARTRRRLDRWRGSLGDRRRTPPSKPLSRTRASRSWKGARAWAAPGISSAIPGIRSDSDMYTLGYSFKPWTNAKSIADGPFDPRVHPRDRARRRHRAVGALRPLGEERRLVERRGALDRSKSSTSRTKAARTSFARRGSFTCNFLHMCTGYYSYEGGYTPEFEGRDDFAGRVVHPQNWTEDIDYRDKKVVVIGSGATAVTLIPELAKKAAEVTMLQRSPTYMVSAPGQDALANALRKALPSRVAYGITRWKNVLLGMFFFWLSRKKPHWVRSRLINAGKRTAPERFRHRDPLQAQLQPVGSAHLPRARCRSLRSGQ